MALAKMLRVNNSLRELGLGRNNVGNEGAAAIADALTCNTTLLRLDLEGNNISEKGAMAILKALKSHNRTVTLLNLKGNVDISPVLWTAIYNARVFNCLISNLHNTLEGMLIPSVIQALHRGSVVPKKPMLVAHRIPATAGFMFYLVRTVASNDAKVVKFPRGLVGEQ
jgi:Leucine Rich repeat